VYIGNTPNNQAYTPAVDFFSGNASTTAFTLSRPVASTYQMLVVVANVTQNPGSAYTVSGNTITFASAPPSGTNNIWVEYTSLITQVIAPSPGTVGTSQLQNNSVGTTQLANLTTLPTSGGNITLPAVAGTAMVSGNMPAFSAYLGIAQTITNNAVTKLSANTKEFDTASAYDNTTNYRFTPLVAGYYQINGQIYISATAISTAYITIYKNGSRFKDGQYLSSLAAPALFLNVNSLIYLNGSTDYIELYGYAAATGTIQFNTNSGTLSYFQASLVRAA